MVGGWVLLPCLASPLQGWVEAHKAPASLSGPALLLRPAAAAAAAHGRLEEEEEDDSSGGGGRGPLLVKGGATSE